MITKISSILAAALILGSVSLVTLFGLSARGSQLARCRPTAHSPSPSPQVRLQLLSSCLRPLAKDRCVRLRV